MEKTELTIAMIKSVIFQPLHLKLSLLFFLKVNDESHF